MILVWFLVGFTAGGIAGFLLAALMFATRER